MNIIAIVGSPRKGKATDMLVDKAIEGVLSKSADSIVKKLNLVEHDIRYCKNCLACRDSQTTEPFARCVIRDDMDHINQDIVRADAIIFGTPVHAGFATAIMTAFLERISWTFAKPTGKTLNISGLPMPRDTKKRKAVIIVTSGVVPPLYRMFCDQATRLIKEVGQFALNAKTIGDMYAGDTEHRGVECYFNKAFALGRKLC